MGAEAEERADREGPPPGWLRRLTRAEPGELAPVLQLFAYNFLVIATYLVIKPIRYSLFLDRIGPAGLPWAYIGTALFVGVFVWCYERLLSRLTRTAVVATTWGLLGGAAALFWVGFRSSAGVVVPALFYFYSAVFGVVGVTLFWSFAAEVFDPKQGRRLFGFVQAGAILGGIAGGALTGRLAPVLGTENLLLVCAVMCGACGALGAGLSRRYPRREEAGEAAPPAGDEAAEKGGVQEAAGGATLVRGSAYLRRVVALIFFFQLVSTLVDFLFQSVVNEAYPMKDARTAFFGDFYSWLGAASFLVQICATTRIHRRLGVGPALLVLPGLAGLGSLGFVAAPGFAAGVFLRAGIGVFDYSLDRATRELLYLPTTTEVKTRAKAFIDMFCFRLFRSLAGVLILVLGKGGAASLGAAGAMALGSALGWVLTARALGGAYVAEVRRALLGPDAPVPSAGAGATPEPELLAAVAGLRDALGGGEEAAARAELAALATRRLGDDLPRALEALHDPDRRALAQELLDGITAPGWERLLVRVLDETRGGGQRARLAGLLEAALGGRRG